MKLRIFVDGASKGNPGPGGAGVYVEDAAGKPLKKFAKPIAHCTNNQAEVAALEAAFHVAKTLGGTELDIYTDSQLLARQFTGQYRVKDAHLKEVWARIRTEIRAFRAVNITHIPREQNTEADALSNIGADKARNLG